MFALAPVLVPVGGKTSESIGRADVGESDVAGGAGVLEEASGNKSGHIYR